MDQSGYHPAQHYGASEYPDVHQNYGYEHPHQQGYYTSDGHHSHSASPYMHDVSIASPPTPLSTHGSDGGRQTRSRRSQARTDSPHSIGKAGSPKRKNTRREKSEKNKNRTPRLTAPLSVLTKDMSIPVRDMEAWVKRSEETRHEEAQKRNGYVTRPMNSFMLYRSAYAERTKQWCAHNNHQVVSAVSGESWPIEPEEIRDFYNELARIERINHQNAHPNYKFCPSKPGGGSRKRKGTADSDSEISSLGDPDAEWGATHKSRMRARPGRDASYPSRVDHIHHIDSTFGPNDGYNKSSWEASNPSRSHPISYGQAVHNTYPSHAHFYQHPMQSHILPSIDDVRFSTMDTQSFSSSLVGLPGASHHELLTMHSRTPTPLPSMEAQIDPMLMPYDAHMPANLAHAVPLDAQSHFNSAFEQEPVVEYQSREWQPEPDTTNPMYSEFDKYFSGAMEGQHGGDSVLEDELRRATHNNSPEQSHDNKGPGTV